MKILTFFFPFFPLMSFGQGGTISFNDSLLFFTEAAQTYHYEWDSTKVIWHRSYNPFCFRCGEVIDTVKVGDSIEHDQLYWAAYAQTIFYSDSIEIAGYATMSTNTIYPPGDHPKFDIQYPNPNNGNYIVIAHTNGWKITTLGYSGQVYLLTYPIGNYAEINIAPLWTYPGTNYLSFRVKFNHPLLKEWIITRTIITL